MYPWVSEGSVRKYHRAIALLTKENAQRKLTNQPEVEITEAAVKALYERWGGLVIGEPDSVRGVEAGEEAAAAQRAEEQQPAKPEVVKKKK